MRAQAARIGLTSPLDLPASLDEGQAFGWTAPDGEADEWWIGTIYGHPVRIRHVEANADTSVFLKFLRTTLICQMTLLRKWSLNTCALMTTTRESGLRYPQMLC